MEMELKRKIAEGTQCTQWQVIKLTDEEIEEAYTEFLKGKFIRDTEYFLEENYDGEFDKETIEAIANDFKESLGNRIEQMENEVFDEVMELNYPEYERNW